MAHGPKMLQPMSGSVFEPQTKNVDIEFTIADCSGKTIYTVTIYPITNQYPGPPMLGPGIPFACTLACKAGNAGAGYAYTTAMGLKPGDYVVYVDDGTTTTLGGSFTIEAPGNLVKPKKVLKKK